MSKHTPGPWVPNEVEVDEQWITAGPEGYLVASVWHNLPRDYKSAANAQLIAAAPDLLEACMVAKDFIVDNAPSQEAADYEVRLLSAAIEKATT